MAPQPRTFAASWAPLAIWALSMIFPGRTAHATGGEILVSLDYATAPALPGCPSAADFRRDVIHQLGRDPFREVAPRRLVVRLSPTGARVAGKVEWRDARDEWEGERTFSSRNESCAQMARAMALATAIQIQLLARVEELAPARPPAGAKAPAPPLEIAPIVVVPAAPAAGPPAPREPWIAVDAGAGVVADIGDSPAFVLPRLAVTLGRPSAFGVRLAVSGLGPGAQVAEPQGSAALDRLLMTLELIRFFRTERRLQPFAAAGAGWQDVRARGTSAMPALAAGHTGQAFSALFAAGGGVTFALATRLALVAEVEALLFRPSVTVQVASAEAAHLDGFSLFVHGGVLARF